MTFQDALRIIWNFFAIIGVFSSAAVVGAFIAYTLNRRTMRLRK